MYTYNAEFFIFYLFIYLLDTQHAPLLYVILHANNAELFPF
jgi:hypothetical protein